MEFDENLKELKTDMEDKGWSIESFLFHYKEVQYVVLVKLYDEQKEKKPQYALVKMEFVDENNNSITIPTNSRGFMNEFVYWKFHATILCISGKLYTN